MASSSKSDSESAKRVAPGSRLISPLSGGYHKRSVPEELLEIVTESKE